MTVRKVDGVLVDADTLDGDQLATIEGTMDTKVSNHDGDAIAHPGIILTFIELAGGEDKVVSNINTWEDWDISAIVPEGTKLVCVVINNTSTTAAHIGGLRVKGSALERKVSLGIQSQSELICQVDANYYIQIYSGDLTKVTFNILGYWS